MSEKSINSSRDNYEADMTVDIRMYQYKKKISREIKMLRESGTMPVKEIERIAGVSRSTVSRVENYKGEYKLETAYKILFAIEENYKISSVNPASRLILNIWQRCPKEYRKTLFDLFELELQNDKTIS